MKKIVIAILPVIIFNAYAAELENENVYRVKTDLEFTLPADQDSKKYSAGENSKFEVLDSNDSKYLIRFEKIYNLSTDDSSENQIDYVNFGKRYYLNKKVDETPVENLVSNSFRGVVSGPLIIPFKYRTGDKSFSGEATLGYYAGWGMDLFDTGVGITPMLSAGLTQVSVADGTGDGTENKSGFTWAAGFLFQNWDGMNIGIVYGEDRIGDKGWEHEGDGWWSISMGWEM
jgi:opacity protein-like surface antigen